MIHGPPLITCNWTNLRSLFYYPIQTANPPFTTPNVNEGTRLSFRIIVTNSVVCSNSSKVTIAVVLHQIMVVVMDAHL